jgi:cytoskeleton protein RodZ
MEAKPVPESIETPFSSRFALRRRQNIIWLTATACVILAAVGFLVWSFNTPTESTAMRKMATVDDPLLPAVSSVDPMVVAQGSVIPQAVTLAASPVHAAASSIVAAPVVSAVEPAPVLQNPMLRLVFDEESWTEIREQSGKTLSSQLNSEGTELRLDGRPPFSLVIGNATSVHLFYKGVEVNLEDHLPHADSSIARLKLE